MKKVFFSVLVFSFSFAVKAQINKIPNQAIKDSMPSLIKKAAIVMSHAYMAQKLLEVTDTIPGWEGFPVKLYEYQTGNDIYTGKPKTGKIFLLGPSPEQLAMWVATALSGSKTQR